jgi:pimeloyl-ACP methyl ester carboxylesterase
MHARQFQQNETNGIRLCTVVEGHGPVVLLLNGFPQGWYLWRCQFSRLVDAGFHVAVPDQRGYGSSHRGPAGVSEDCDLTRETTRGAGLARWLRGDVATKK